MGPIQGDRKATALDDKALDQVFREARTHNSWQDRRVSEAVLRRLYDPLKMGPSSANCSPTRFVFVQSSTAMKREDSQ